MELSLRAEHYQPIAGVDQLVAGRIDMTDAVVIIERQDRGRDVVVMEPAQRLTDQRTAGRYYHLADFEVAILLV